MDGVDFKLIGMNEVLGRLDSISHDAKYKGGRFALRKAANLVRDKARANAAQLDDPSSDENIAKNIVVRWSGRTFKSTGDLKFRVGVMGGAGGRAKGAAYDSLPGKDTRHWRMLEFGTSKMRARPFMRRALSENTSQAIDEFARHFEPAINRAIKRAKKR